MGIDISFVLRASTAAFTKGLATASNGLKDLKKGLKELDVPREFLKLLGPGIFVVGLKRLIEDAQKTREEFEKLGKPLDDATRRVAEYGDTLRSVGKTVTNWGIQGVATVSQVAESFGFLSKGVCNGFDLEKTKTDWHAFRDTLRDLEATERRVAQGRERVQNANSVENLATLDKQIAEARRAAAMAGMSDQSKINAMKQEEIDLEKRLAVAKEVVAGQNDALLKSMELQLEKSRASRVEAEKQLKEKAIGLKNQISGLEAQKSDQEEKAMNTKRDRFLPSLVQLAGMQAFGEDDLRSISIHQARKVLQTEEQASLAGQRGNIDEAVRLQGVANQLRSGLAGSIKSDEADAGREIVTGIDKTNEQLAEANRKLSGLFKAQ